MAGCDVFDEGLIPPEGSSGSAGTTGGPPVLKWDEDVSCTLPIVESLSGYHKKEDVASALASVPRLPACLGNANAAGQDFFFRVDMKEGEKWHFHIDPGDGYDPTIYVLNRCDNTEACASPEAGINACKQNQPEHFSFIAPRSDIFVVGIDSLEPGSGGMPVLAVNAVCGNGKIEHSEYCDTATPPGHTDYKLDCDGCRKKIAHEGEDGTSFNDGPLDFAILDVPNPLIPGRDFRFNAVAGDKACDFDFFRFQLPEDTSVRIELTSSICSGWDLKVGETNDPYDIDGGDECPNVLVELEEGEQQFRVAATSELQAAKVGYEIRLTFGEDATAED
jgi:hypothetical protein